MPAISELWIDYPISYRDEKGRFVKGHNYGFKKEKSSYERTHKETKGKRFLSRS